MIWEEIMVKQESVLRRLEKALQSIISADVFISITRIPASPVIDSVNPAITAPRATTNETTVNETATFSSTNFDTIEYS